MMSNADPRPTIDTDALNAFLQAIGSYTPELILGPAQDQPLHHYTDLAGLQGIMNQNDLWLTHSRYSNDEEEITHGYRTIREVIEAKRTERTTVDWQQYLNELAQLVDKPVPQGVYVCCFC